MKLHEVSYNIKDGWNIIHINNKQYNLNTARVYNVKRVDNMTITVYEKISGEKFVLFYSPLIGSQIALLEDAREVLQCYKIKF